MARNKQQLEEDFKEVEAQVNAKLKEAADALLEANAIAKTKGFKANIQGIRELMDLDLDLMFNSDYLEDAMDNSGWNTSSWYC